MVPKNKNAKSNPKALTSTSQLPTFTLQQPSEVNVGFGAEQQPPPEQEPSDHESETSTRATVSDREHSSRRAGKQPTLTNHHQRMDSLVFQNNAKSNTAQRRRRRKENHTDHDDNANDNARSTSSSPSTTPLTKSHLTKHTKAQSQHRSPSEKYTTSASCKYYGQCPHLRHPSKKPGGPRPPPVPITVDVDEERGRFVRRGLYENGVEVPRLGNGGGRYYKGSWVDDVWRRVKKSRAVGRVLGHVGGYI
ncbi:hypothetical protein EJ08DRAFT_697044 [Tothia fuscella]|uniref:Uncharacterized protein n=1 Tax=Tothia fuscella TaxID=1048955 RepID=A0A9P4TXY0_9PEZI|nr:hypothetical protein EJ08DRAFT_697044 [Tothia fuscella]